MSKNKHFRKQFVEDNATETVEEVIENQVEEVVDENINSDEEVVTEFVEETIENPSEETIEDDIVLEVLGVVTGCNLLNVRSQPEADSNIVTVIPIDSIVTISDVNASQDFYKVLIGDLEGYCMKKFIKIKE